MRDAYPKEGERESEMGGEREMGSRPNLKTSLAKRHARQRQQQQQWMEKNSTVEERKKEKGRRGEKSLRP